MAGTQRTKSGSQPDIIPFLTAWDPSDLPGGSVDPLGFDRGYSALADKILPGLTNVAAFPRYFGLLCAGASLGPDTVSPSRTEVEERRDCILRLERLWALAVVLAAEGGGPDASGVRGVTYAQAQRDVLARSGTRRTSTNFPLLTRQVQYGVLGMYGNVAHGMSLVNRKTLQLSADFGEALGHAFLAETQIPKSVRDAARDASAEVGTDVLRSWGLRAGLASESGTEEARMLDAALRLDGVRARTAAALRANPAKDQESELGRLARLAPRLGKSDRDLAEAIEAISAFERCYAWSLLVFERVLWRCGAGGAVTLSELGADEVLQRGAAKLPSAVANLERAIGEATTSEFGKNLDRLDDIRSFLAKVTSAGSNAAELSERVLARHVDVQQGKFDRGRRKLPWVELAGDKASLTMARATQVRGEPRRPEDIPTHEYRTRSADALLRASEGARHG